MGRKGKGGARQKEGEKAKVKPKKKENGKKGTKSSER